MLRSVGRWFGVALGSFVVMVATAASAQVVGTFRWQFAPYCSVVTLQVEQKGSLYELAGTDDQCGGDVVAAAKGSAHVNPNGTIGLALTVVRPDGLTIASSVALNPKTFSGSWQDEYANTGAFVFNPTSPASGPPRLITLTGSITTASWATGPSHITFTPFFVWQNIACAAHEELCRSWKTVHHELSGERRKSDGAARSMGGHHSLSADAMLAHRLTRCRVQWSASRSGAEYPRAHPTRDTAVI